MDMFPGVRASKTTSWGWVLCTIFKDVLITRTPLPHVVISLSLSLLSLWGLSINNASFMSHT